MMTEQVPDAGWRHTIAYAASVKIIGWNVGQVGVRYDYAGGDSEAHQVGPDDWPLIRHFRDAGKLTFQSDDIRERFDRMKPISDDPS